MMQLLFTCAICKRDVTDYPDRNGRDRCLAPFCRSCEGRYSDTTAKAGSFMDRRLLKQLSAITNALNGEAHAKTWSRRYGIS